MKRFLLPVFLFLFSCKSAPQASSTLPNQKLQDKLETLAKENELPGMNFSLIYADGSAENYSAGFADVEAKIPLNKDHVFFSGSIGKTYAAALLMQLMEAGQVDLQKKWISYFPETDWVKQIPNIENISVEMLLQHTSGLTEFVMKPEIWETLATQPDKIWSYEDRLSHIFGDDPVHEAGKGWGYSDTNYILIGMLIERVSGVPYYELVRKNLLDKFKLTQTHPSLSREIPNLASGYSKLPPFFQMPEKVAEGGKYVFNPQVEWTGGGFNSSTSDLAKWAKIYFEAQAFSKETLSKITTINPNGKNPGGGDSYGMGAFIFEMSLGTAYGHSGFMPGYNSLFAYFPKQKVAAAIQVNCDYVGQKASLNSFMEQLVAVALGE